MPQLSIRLSETLLDSIDGLPGKDERSEKIRWLIKKGLEQVETEKQLEQIEQIVDRATEMAGELMALQESLETDSRRAPSDQT